MTTNPRSTRQYVQWRARVLKHCEPICIRCGDPVDLELPRTHPLGASADHEPPLAETGEIAPSLDQSGIAHLQCNRSHGGRIGSARALANKKQATNTTTKRTKQTQTRFLDTDTGHSRRPSTLSPQGDRVAPDTDAQRPVFHSDGWVLPRLETARPASVVGSLGADATAWVGDVLGITLRPWQAYALERALEVDAQGRLVWSKVIITVGRQSGKSVLSRAACMWRIHQAAHFEETQTVLHVANRRATAVEVMRPAGRWASERYGKKAVKWGNVEAGIELPTGDRWLVQAANDSAGVGYTVSMVFVDEAWRVKREVVDDALAPTMAEREQPQLWLVSTAGDSASDLMSAYRSRAVEHLHEPSDLLLLEWSAPAAADATDPEVWPFGSPEWNPKRAGFLKSQFEAIELEAFRREFLNQWTISANHWLRDSMWTETITTDPLPADAAWTVAVESDFDGSGHAVAIAAPDADGVIHFTASTFLTMREVDQELASIRRRHPMTRILITPSFMNRLTTQTDGVVGNREATTATQVLLEAFDKRQLRHPDSISLREQFTATSISRRQGGWVLSAPAGRGGVYAARAVMFAVWEASKAPRPVPMIRTRRGR